MTRHMDHRIRDRRSARVLTALIGSALAASVMAGCANQGDEDAATAAPSSAAAPATTSERTPESSATSSATSAQATPAKSSAAAEQASEIPRDALPDNVGDWQYYAPVKQVTYKKGDKQLLVSGPTSQSDSARARDMLDNIREFDGGFCGELGKTTCQVTLGKRPDVIVTVGSYTGNASMDEMLEFSKGLAAAR